MIYPLGYIFLCISFQVICSFDRINQYYNLYQTLQKYEKVLSEKYNDSPIKLSDNPLLDHIEVSVKATSEFARSCIILSTLSEQTSKVAQGNIVLQAVVTAYAMLNSFFEIIKYNKEQKKIVESMSYKDMVMQYPHLVLIEYQFKIVKLLFEMHNSSNLAERVFARIHLVAVVLPKPYEGLSKKYIKKIYKKYFNAQGDLVFLEESEEKTYAKFLKNITIDWQYLVLKVHKFSTKITLFKESEYAFVLDSYINQRMLAMIDAVRNNDLEVFYAQRPHFLEKNLQELYDFLSVQIESRSYLK